MSQCEGSQNVEKSNSTQSFTNAKGFASASTDAQKNGQYLGRAGSKPNHVTGSM